jgi:hypothetical protein
MAKTFRRSRDDYDDFDAYEKKEKIRTREKNRNLKTADHDAFFDEKIESDEK